MIYEKNRKFKETCIRISGRDDAVIHGVIAQDDSVCRQKPKRKKPPLYEEVKDLLDEDEVVKAKDYEITVGSEFDVTCDFTGLEIKDDEKSKSHF